MKQKINILTILSTIVLLALCIMQYYLVKTTYNYKVAQFKIEVKEKLAQITNDYSDIDSTLFNNKDYIYNELAENYLVDRNYRSQIRKQLIENHLRKQLTEKLQKKFNKEFPDNSIDFAIILNKFVMYTNAKKVDTLFAEKPFIENKMYGNLNSLDDAFLIRNYVGTTSANTSKSKFKLLTEDSLYVSVKNWELIVLKRMSLLLIFAFASIITLITIFVITIKSLIKQKKISDIKTDFINNITHELKTPLTTLSVSTKILERKEVKENDLVYNQLIQTINRQNERLQNLIDQVMSNSLGFEEIELNKEKIKTNSFLHTIIDDFKLANPSIEIQTSFNSETQLTLDKFHLTTAIVNVLENAVKYGAKTIYVTTNIENNEFKISIEDDGIGIAKNKQSLLFDKFYRVEKGNLHNTKGLGLGLYYVDQIIKAHKGTINLVSDLGKGTRLTLSIPS
ncbi:sensor histidine kinase KdpD [Flavobacterium sp.]|uniref:sensor histidine kinase n=1 Tax=Flavobacterium sp. TaxID=239 RepID=UPI00262D1DE8|nr:HAMP domain-containing sensor histidine kinase [Flavobacterium sp.]